jgi:hypothetical protein
LVDQRQRLEDGFPRVVVWTRGQGCAELAELLATRTAHKAETDLVTSCVLHRADLAVSVGGGSFDAAHLARPISFTPDTVTSVVAAVAGGPHSRLAAMLAGRLGTAIGVPAEAVSGHRGSSDRLSAVAALRAAGETASLAGRLVEVRHPSDLIEALPDGALIVLGAAGGSWLSRQFFGPGKRLTANAPSGAVVVHWTAPKAYQRMEELAGYGVHLRAGDAQALSFDAVLAVVDDGKLVGIVRRERLLEAHADVEIGDLVESAPPASVLDTVHELAELAPFFDGAPIPVVDRHGNLAGGIPLEPSPFDAPADEAIE